MMGRRSMLLSMAMACTALVAHRSAAAAADPIFANHFEQYTLTIVDYLNWCSVSVNGGVATTLPPPQAFVEGTVVSLSGDTANANFWVWGYWTGTDGVDAGTGEDSSKSTTVTMSSNRNVLACCPDKVTPNNKCT